MTFLILDSGGNQAMKVGMTNLGASNEEHEAGHSADAVQPSDVREVIEIIPDVVLQEPCPCQLSLRLQRGTSLLRRCHIPSYRFATTT